MDRVDYLITISGAIEITCAGGLRVFGPGDVLFAEDLKGEGHSNRELHGPRMSLIIQVTRGLRHSPLHQAALKTREQCDSFYPSCLSFIARAAEKFTLILLIPYRCGQRPPATRDRLAHAPYLGEHTREMGYGAADIEKLTASGAFACYGG